MQNQLDCQGRILDLSSPKVMGVLNITPDSFSDGGQYTDVESAVHHAIKMVEAGADIIDIGGESTRPGASAVSAEEEIKRVIPVVETLVRKDLGVVISVDTSKPGVMRAAIDAGAGLINDVRALQEPGALEVIVDSTVPVCLMHMQGEPRNMQQHPIYHDLIKEIYAFLDERVWACVHHGVSRNRLLIDPGFGFGKSLDHNLSLLKHLDQFCKLDLPVLVGLSRKSMIGTILDVSVDKRLIGSIAAAMIAITRGASIVRVHDVAETMDAIRIYNAVNQAK